MSEKRVISREVTFDSSYPSTDLDRAHADMLVRFGL